MKRLRRWLARLDERVHKRFRLAIAREEARITEIKAEQERIFEEHPEIRREVEEWRNAR